MHKSTLKTIAFKFWSCLLHKFEKNGFELLQGAQQWPARDFQVATSPHGNFHHFWLPRISCWCGMHPQAFQDILLVRSSRAWLLLSLEVPCRSMPFCQVHFCSVYSTYVTHAFPKQMCGSSELLRGFSFYTIWAQHLPRPLTPTGVCPVIKMCHSTDRGPTSLLTSWCSFLSIWEHFLPQ